MESIGITRGSPSVQLSVVCSVKLITWQKTNNRTQSRLWYSIEKDVKDNVLASVSLEIRKSLETKRSVISSVSLLESKGAWYKLCYRANIPRFSQSKISLYPQ